MTNHCALNDSEIFVRSHVPRDLLQNAALFKNDKMVVWEYVANGLEYVDEGVYPVVKVFLDNKKKRIEIHDNGRGMDWAGLKNFFVMHGENVDRARGKPGRGRFGTGKSAAFGIADDLRITTVRNGKRSQIELKRGAIEQLQSGEPIPVVPIEREVPTTQKNGTKVEIDGSHLKSFDVQGIRQYIERQLARWRNATVFVNNHECEFIEPPVTFTRTFRPEGELLEKLGEVELVIKVAGIPLEEEFRGIAIYSKGVWYESTLAGNDNREWSNYIFGEIDVPRLDDDRSPISPFDLSRNMRLNSNNELVIAIYAFIGYRVDQVRRELVKLDKERRATEESQKLASQAAEIARVINEDFNDFQQRVIKARAKAGDGFDSGVGAEGGQDASDIVYGTEVRAAIIEPTGGPGSEGGARSGGEDPRSLNPTVDESPEAEEKQGKYSGGKDSKRASRGGFRVEFRQMGSNAPRATYAREERTIYINLDHPQFVSAKGTNSTDDPVFRKLAYEVGFTEYAIALAAELNSSGEYGETMEPILDIRETINRVARRAAALYAA